MKDYPLYPELTSLGEIEAQELMDGFKVKVKELIHEAVEEVMGNIYSDIVPYIMSDSWTNFRNDIMDGMRNYNNRKIQAEYDFKKIRQQIYEEFRDDIINDLDQDNLKKIVELEKQIAWLQECDRRFI